MESGLVIHSVSPSLIRTQSAQQFTFLRIGTGFTLEQPAIVGGSLGASEAVGMGTAPEHPVRSVIAVAAFVARFKAIHQVVARRGMR